MLKHVSFAPSGFARARACSRIWLWVSLAFALVSVIQPEARAADPSEGRKTYMAHCQNCHGSNGVGQMPGIPDFSRGEALLQPDAALVRTIQDGKGMMPAYRGLLTEEQLLDVVAFLRTLR